MSLVSAIKTVIKLHKADKSFQKYKKIYDKAQKIRKEAAKQDYSTLKGLKKGDLVSQAKATDAELAKLRAAVAAKLQKPDNYSQQLYALYQKYLMTKGPGDANTINRYKDMLRAIPDDLKRFRAVWMDVTQAEQNLARMLRDCQKVDQVLRKLQAAFGWGVDTLPKVGPLDLKAMCFELYQACGESLTKISEKAGLVRQLQKTLGAAKAELAADMDAMKAMQAEGKKHPVPPGAEKAAPAR